MEIPQKQFEKWVAEALENLPEKYLRHMNNVAIFVEDYPTPEQRRKFQLRRGMTIFGLYEGYHQSLRLNVGSVLPDKITIFRKPIVDFYDNEKDIRKQIKNTVQHEIAHHFGSGEEGAQRAGKKTDEWGYPQ